eukprot:Sdes_comp18901_c0_seq2m9346
MSPKTLKTDIIGYYHAKEMVKREKEIVLPHMFCGSIVRVKYKESQKKKPFVFVGYVIGIFRKRLDTCIHILNNIRGSGVIVKIPIYSPRLLDIEVVRYDKKRKAKLFYLKDKPLREWTVKKTIAY